MILFILLSILFSPLQSCLAENAKGNVQEQSFKQIVQWAMPAVVYIRSERDGKIPHLLSEEFFERFFSPPAEKLWGTGSGFFIDGKGHILTNAHIVEGAKSIRVSTHDDRELTAEVVGIDENTDLAIVKVKGKGFTCLEFADSDAIEVADWVMAIGNPLGLRESVSVGVVSAKGRRDLSLSNLSDFIQTDAVLNPGNSGGPLLSREGKVIGVNTAISTNTGGHMGLGFAIPSNIAKHATEQLIAHGIVSRGYLGIVVQKIDEDMAKGLGLKKTEGLLIVDVNVGSAAAKAGLQRKDVILQISSRNVSSPENLRKEIAMLSPGTKIDLEIRRGDKKMTIPVSLGQNAAVSLSKLGMNVSELNSRLCRQLNVESDQQGVAITKVWSNSPADRAGLRPGLIIVAINREEVVDMDSLQKALEKEKGPVIAILVLHPEHLTLRFHTIKLS